MAAVEKVEPPHEPEGGVRFDELYAGRDFYDDGSGMPLDRNLSTQVRKNEISRTVEYTPKYGENLR